MFCLIFWQLLISEPVSSKSGEVNSVNGGDLLSLEGWKSIQEKGINVCGIVTLVYGESDMQCEIRIKRERSSKPFAVKDSLGKIEIGREGNPISVIIQNRTAHESSHRP